MGKVHSISQQTTGCLSTTDARFNYIFIFYILHATSAITQLVSWIYFISRNPYY